MNTKPYPAPLTGLSDVHKSELEGLSTLALEVEASRLGLAAKRLQLQAFGAGDKASIDRDAAHLVASDAALKEMLVEAPHLAKPVAEIVELARRAREDDPKAGELLGAVRTELKGVALKGANEHVAEQHVAPVHLPNEVEGEGPAAALSSRYDPKAVPEVVTKRYTVRGKEFLDPRDDKVAFVDHGSRLQTNKSFDGQAIKAMVAIAESRGWDSIKVSGDEAFRRAVWLEAASRGIAVNGYKPTEAEKKAVVSMAERNGSLNRIEENPAAKAFLDAKDGSGRYSAAKAHPELKTAFVMEAALRRFAEQRLLPKDREPWIERQRQNMANDVAQGKDIPAAMVRAKLTQQRDRDRRPEAER